MTFATSASVGGNKIIHGCSGNRCAGQLYCASEGTGMSKGKFMLQLNASEQRCMLESSKQRNSPCPRGQQSKLPCTWHHGAERLKHASNVDMLRISTSAATPFTFSTVTSQSRENLSSDLSGPKWWMKFLLPECFQAKLNHKVLVLGSLDLGLSSPIHRFRSEII